MFDFAWSEFALIGMVALLVIGPKDMPTAIRAVARMVRKARGLATEFQSHVDEMVREADLGEVRDHVRDLRNFDVRGRVMRAVDGDGKIRRAFDDPLARSGLLTGPAAQNTSSALSPHTPSSDGTLAGVIEPPLPPAIEIGSPAPPPVANVSADHDQRPKSPPAVLPPSTARRVMAERRRLAAPSILPPIRVLHGTHRVAPFAASAAQTKKSADHMAIGEEGL
ncbi:twin-arginine translocase subunit TatB [Acetobacter sacchari]|uniref:Sec-independent protein translocase protein TatB n=2 Tax=Acetobacter sacchari TaxID=2661687 RepID=A0ABS3LXE0_9PROT|nr:Sec-independent protein translocase protein TatB [Acetobacter sacchari]MBO1360589.1 twin-arginine translocase subunit TatB [Acetobacter sacchari]